MIFSLLVWWVSDSSKFLALHLRQASTWSYWYNWASLIFRRSIYAWGFCLVWRSTPMIVHDLSMEMFVYKSWHNLDLLINNVLSVNISEWQINLKAKSQLPNIFVDFVVVAIFFFFFSPFSLLYFRINHFFPPFCKLHSIFFPCPHHVLSSLLVSEGFTGQRRNWSFIPFKMNELKNYRLSSCWVFNFCQMKLWNNRKEK